MKAVVIIKKRIVKSAVEWSHEFIAQILEEGSCVIDATAGNGRDTLYLAELVGKTGKVYAFDIQKEAILKTEKLLEEAGLEKQVSLFHQNHEKMAEEVKDNVDAVIFVDFLRNRISINFKNILFITFHIYTYMAVKS